MGMPPRDLDPCNGQQKNLGKELSVIRNSLHMQCSPDSYMVGWNVSTVLLHSMFQALSKYFTAWADKSF